MAPPRMRLSPARPTSARPQGPGGAPGAGGDGSATGAGDGAGVLSAATGSGAGVPVDTDDPAGAEPLPDAASPITASVTPTSTVSPSSTRMAVSTPSAGDGTSESTLSVDTSNKGSSRATWSPTALYHLVMVPSVTVSPSCGMVTSGNVESPSGQGLHRLAERLGQRRMGLDELGHLIGSGLPIDGQVAGAELLGDPGPDHVDTEDPSGGPVGEALGHHLDQALGVPDDPVPGCYLRRGPS